MKSIQHYPFSTLGIDQPYSTGEKVEYQEKQVRGRYPSHDLILLKVRDGGVRANLHLMVNFEAEVLYPHLIAGVVPVALGEVLVSKHRASDGQLIEGTFVPGKLMDWINETARDRFMADRKQYLDLMKQLFLDLESDQLCACFFPRIFHYVQANRCSLFSEIYLKTLELEERNQLSQENQFADHFQLRCKSCGSLYRCSYAERGAGELKLLESRAQPIGRSPMESPPHYIYYRNREFRGWDYGQVDDQAKSPKEVYQYLLAR